MASITALENRLQKLTDADRSWSDSVTFQPPWPGLRISVWDEAHTKLNIVSDYPPTPPTVKSKKTGKVIPVERWDRMAPMERATWIRTGKLK